MTNREWSIVLYCVACTEIQLVFNNCPICIECFACQLITFFSLLDMQAIRCRLFPECLHLDLLLPSNCIHINAIGIRQSGTPLLICYTCICVGDEHCNGCGSGGGEVHCHLLLPVQPPLAPQISWQKQQNRTYKPQDSLKRAVSAETPWNTGSHRWELLLILGIGRITTIWVPSFWRVWWPSSLKLQYPGSISIQTLKLPSFWLVHGDS